jgi:thiol-disulfide isomerase/thioredoxin
MKHILRSLGSALGFSALLPLIVGAAMTTGACQSSDNGGGGKSASKKKEFKADPDKGCYQDGPACLPPIDYVDTTGKVWTPDELSGKVVVINFWATWCRPCQFEIPDLAKVARKYKDQGFIILGFMSDQPSDAKLKAFRERYGLDYPVIRVDRALSDAFGQPRALPTNFVYDRNGHLVFDRPGAVSAAQLEHEIKGLL